MKILRKLSRWSKSAKRGLRALWPVREKLPLPPWRAVDLPYGRGIALSLEGQDLWLVSPDVTLEPTQEAAVCLLAQWCAQEKISLRLPEKRPSSAFLANVLSATELMGSWWKHPAIRFLTPDALALPPPAVPSVNGKKALFFSGGIDAFYSLVKNPHVDVLVYIIGYDIPLADRPAWEMKLKSLREVARARGTPLITVFTNRCEHPTLKAMSWGNHFGGVLAAVAHSLHAQASNWIISASLWPGYLMPCGSHPDLDWRWGCESIAFLHFGVDQWRGEKLAAMADDEIAFHHLMVCFKTSTAGNCGKCEKCVRTRLAHHCEVPGRRCEYMPDSPTLLEAVDGLKFIRSPILYPNYERSRSLLPSGDPLVAAIDRLIERSLPKPWWSRLKAYLLRHL